MALIECLAQAYGGNMIKLIQKTGIIGLFGLFAISCGTTAGQIPVEKCKESGCKDRPAYGDLQLEEPTVLSKADPRLIR